MKNGFLFLIFLGSFACHNVPSKPTPYEIFLEANGQKVDLWIKQGQLLDGSGSAPYASDILIKNDTIAFIGQVDSSKIQALKIIDAKDKIVTPGFIDAHAHGNPSKTPNFKNFLAMGVTSICLGQDGSSPSNDMTNWIKSVEKQALGVNIIPFVGHGTLRRTAGINFSKNPTANQLAKQQQLLTTALEAGCFGMTTGLEYTPGIFADDTELLPLAKIIGEHDGLIMSHVRNEDDEQVALSIQELLRQGKYCNVQVSHMKSVYGKGKNRAKALLDLLEENQSDGHTVTADVYPYTASYTGIGIVFPKWAKAPNDYRKVVKERRKELLAFLKQKIIDRNGPDATLFGTAPYAGKTLAQVSQEMGRSYEEVLMSIGPNKASGAYFIMDEDLQEAIIAHPKVMVCSDGSPTMRHPRGYGSFAKIIEEYVLKRKTISLVEAIRKMTALPAQTIGITKRGFIKEGFYADLLIFEPENIHANATYEKPHLLAEGIDFILINGQITLQEGKMLNNSLGRMLRKVVD